MTQLHRIKTARTHAKAAHAAITRRGALQMTGAAVMVSTVPMPAFARADAMQAAIKDMFGNRAIKDGRVDLDIPPISENGFSVSFDITVQSPMTPEDYVKRIALFSPRNPVPLIAAYTLTPRSGAARVSGRIRLGGTQSVQAVAEMSDGALYGTAAETVVTLAACVIQ